MLRDDIQDRIARGMGIAAKRLGGKCDLYRPTGPGQPIVPDNRVLQLPASFNAQNPSYAKPNGYGRAVWFGVFDSAYTRPGDYLAGDEGVFFVAAQQPLLPVSLQTADLVSDDLGRTFIISAAEQSELGWRCIIQQMAT